MLEKIQFMTLMFLAKPEDKDNERGATATEYGLLVGLIALIIVAGVGLFGNALDAFFSGLAGTVGGW
jgi:pilus assembly protein Flp/PilA